MHFYFNAEKRVHTKRYDGEWVDGRCSVSGQRAPPVSSSLPSFHSLPSSLASFFPFQALTT